MNPVLRKLKGRWFLGDFYSHLTSKYVFHCIEKLCPYSAKMNFVVRDGKKTPTSVEKVLCEFHCHAFPGKKKAESHAFIDREIAVIESKNDEDGSLARKYKEWQDAAKAQSMKVADALNAKIATVDYACKHPCLSGREVREQYPAMKIHAIDMARLRQMKKQGRVTNMDDLIQNRNHHLLKNDSDEIIIFGLKSAVGIMATTQMILADGTFKCVLPDYSQLYILHAAVQNNVSFPMFFCLLKGKGGYFYTRLLELIEEIAREDGTAIFNRPVTVMSDFEAAFIRSVKTRFPPVNVKCCFYFMKNTPTRTTPLMTTIRPSAGETSEEYRLAQRTKRRLMMLPLLPEELITLEVVGLVHRSWKEGCPKHQDALDSLIATVLRTYVVTRPTSATPTRPTRRSLELSPFSDSSPSLRNR